MPSRERDTQNAAVDGRLDRPPNKESTNGHRTRRLDKTGENDGIEPGSGNAGPEPSHNQGEISWTLQLCS